MILAFTIQRFWGYLCQVLSITLKRKERTTKRKDLLHLIEMGDGWNKWNK